MKRRSIRNGTPNTNLYYLLMDSVNVVSAMPYLVDAMEHEPIFLIHVSPDCAFYYHAGVTHSSDADSVC